MQVTISQNIRISGAPMPIRLDIMKDLIIDNPEYSTRIRQKRPTWGIEPKIKIYVQEFNDIIAPRGYQKQLETLLASKYPNEYRNMVKIDARTAGRTVDFGKWIGPNLYDYQAEAMEAIKRQSGVLVAPAGSGKTNIGMKYIHDISLFTLWLTHTQDLMYQSKARAESTLEGVGRIGILGDGVEDWGDGKLIIATAQTMQQNYKYVERLNDLVGLVVIDEAHHFPAPLFAEVAGKFKAQYMLGLTATPDRKDQLEALMFAGIGPKLHTIERGNLYDDGQLVKPNIRFIFTEFGKDQASTVTDEGAVDAGGEDLNYQQLLQDLTEDKERLQLLARNITAAANEPNAYSIVIAESVRYCYYLKEAVENLTKGWKKPPRMAVVHGGLTRHSWKVAPSEFEAEKLADKYGTEYKYDKAARRWKVKTPQYSESEFQDWQVTGTQRKDILEAAKNKQIDILFATQLAREGLDIPHLNIGHMATPKKGDASGRNDGAALEQEMGRIMRRDPMNPLKAATWYDYVDYNVGVFKQQYQSRRRTYKRLGLKTPPKPRTAADDAIDFLGAGHLFF